MKTLHTLVRLLLLAVIAVAIWCGQAFRRASRHPLFQPCVVALALLALAILDHHTLLAAPFCLGVLTEGQHTGEFILSEANGNQSRDTVTVTVPASTTMPAGKVLGQISATGKYVPYDDAHTDGSEEAAGILYDNVTNDDDAPADINAVIVNTNAEVRLDDLQFEDDVDEDAAVADLRALGIKAR